MLERSHMGKGGGKDYDPQVGAAAAANSALAERSQQFSEDYYNTHISPLLDQQSALAAKADAREQSMFDTNKSLMDQANERYQRLGIPAEDAYYQMVKNYSGPEEEQRQAEGAIGDARTAAQGQGQDMRRRLSSMGIDPSSPAAIAAMSDQSVQNAAVEAAAANKARTAAKALGMQLTGDAANFGRGQSSQVTQFGSAASGNLQTGANITGGAVAGAVSGAAPVQTGYGLGVQAQSANLNAYTKLQDSSMQQQGQAAAGLGNFLGQAAGAAITHYSDRRLKRDIQPVGRFADGVNLYKFNYVWEPTGTAKHTGFMADEVEKVWPAAVSTDGRGFKMVDYSKVTH